MMHRLIFAAFLIMLATSCASPRLYGRLEKMNQHSLASTPLATPDPLREHFAKGQQLIVSWLLSPKINLKKQPHFLIVDLIFSNGLHKQVKTAIFQHSGYWNYQSDESESSYTVASFKLQISDSHKIVQVFEHKLFKPFIDLDHLREDQDDDVDSFDE